MRRESTSGTETESAYYWYDAANALTERTVYPGPVNTYYYYDANGALTEMMEAGDTTYFEYGDNQLISKITPPVADGEPWEFWYDAMMNRYAIDKGGTVSYYTWDRLKPFEERDSGGSLVARYSQGFTPIPGVGSIPEVQRVADGTTYYQYPLMDHRGTAYAVTDANEAVQINYTLDAFGRELASEGGSDPSVPNDLISQSDWLTIRVGNRRYGLSLYRLFDFETGVFMSRDLLPYPNKYRAFLNNPVILVDPLGLRPCCKVLHFWTPSGSKGRFYTLDDYINSNPRTRGMTRFERNRYRIGADGVWESPEWSIDAVFEHNPQQQYFARCCEYRQDVKDGANPFLVDGKKPSFGRLLGFQLNQQWQEDRSRFPGQQTIYYGHRIGQPNSQRDRYFFPNRIRGTRYHAKDEPGGSCDGNVSGSVRFRGVIIDVCAPKGEWDYSGSMIDDGGKIVEQREWEVTAERSTQDAHKPLPPWPVPDRPEDIDRFLDQYGLGFGTGRPDLPMPPPPPVFTTGPGIGRPNPPGMRDPRPAY